MAGPVALVGSGEYLPVMADVERGLLAGRPGRFVQLPTAAGGESPDSIDRWVRLGAEQAERLGVEAVPLRVLTREDAEDEEHAAAVSGAGLVYLSGGDPTYLAGVLRGTAVWRAVEAAWESGAALAGCSAGAMALGSHVPDIRRVGSPGVEGLGVVPHVRVLPHFDRYFGRFPARVTEFVGRVPAGVHLVGVDEDTALVGGPEDWEVMGRQSAWVLRDHHRAEHPAGTLLRLPLPS